MAVKQTGQLGFLDALGFSGSGFSALGRNARLERVSGLVDWPRLDAVLAHLRGAGPGRPSYPPLVMLRVVLLQSLYGLSDAQTEEALGDRLSFRRFAGLSLEDAAPDHTTICRFRNLLVDQGLLDKLFDELNSQLDRAGLILRRGTMLDATVIETSAARPTDTKPSSDPDAHFTRRQGKAGSSFGYKAHVGVDEGSGLIRRVITTPANINDTSVADGLVCGDERVVLADAAYHTHAREHSLRARGIKPRLMRRPNRHRPKLPPRLICYNKLVARRRAAVETTFATLKHRMGLAIIRYRGLAKAAGQIVIAAMAFNLRRWVTLAA